MDLKTYFENSQGLGVLATADSQGKVDVALYARPHVVDDSTVSLIMSDRLSHQNLQSNPHAAYLFVEDGPGHKGHRLELTKLREDTSPDLIEATRRKARRTEDDSARFLVYFRVDKVRPAVGG
jgi:putative heme iron utilization protein